MTEQGGSAGQGNRPRVNTPAGMFIRDLAEGTKLQLTNGAVIEVTLNAKDGGWLMGRYLESPNDPALVGTEDWVFFGEVAGEVD